MLQEREAVFCRGRRVERLELFGWNLIVSLNLLSLIHATATSCPVQNRQQTTEANATLGITSDQIINSNKNSTNKRTVYPAFAAPNINTGYRTSCGPTYVRILVPSFSSSRHLPSFDMIHHTHLSTASANSLNVKSLNPWERSSLLMGKDMKGRLGLRTAMLSMRVGRGRAVQAL